MITLQVYYQVYENNEHEVFSQVREMLNNLASFDIEPEYILKVTWDNMAPAYTSTTTEVTLTLILTKFLEKKRIPWLLLVVKKDLAGFGSVEMDIMWHKY